VSAAFDLDLVVEHYASLGLYALDPAKHPCVLHGTHRPEPLITIRHHIVPLGMGGPNEPGNWLDCCDTGHRNLHTLLGPMCQKGTPGWGTLPPHTGARAEQHWAREAFERWVGMGCPGNPHAAYGLA
jgi:hypothetical protein